MSGHTATPQLEVPGIRSLRDGARRLTSYWWVLFVAGIAWVAISLVVLQFDQASDGAEMSRTCRHNSESVQPSQRRRRRPVVAWKAEVSRDEH